MRARELGICITFDRSMQVKGTRKSHAPKSHIEREKRTSGHACLIPNRATRPFGSALKGDGINVETHARSGMDTASAHSACRNGPLGAQWLHEIKVDGFRMAARLEHGRAKLLTRTGLDWSDK